MTGATGLRLFVVCLRHTTKPLLHSAKGLPMATHKKADSATKKSRQRALCRVLFVEHMVKVSVFRWAHNKVFAICQKTLGKHRYRYKKKYWERTHRPAAAPARPYHQVASRTGMARHVRACSHVGLENRGKIIFPAPLMPI